MELSMSDASSKISLSTLQRLNIVKEHHDREQTDTHGFPAHSLGHFGLAGH